MLSNITYIVRLFLGDVQLLAVERKEEKAVMGISAKWIKSLVGIKKHEKGRNAECSDAVSQPVQMSIARVLACIPVGFFAFAIFFICPSAGIE